MADETTRAGAKRVRCPKCGAVPRFVEEVSAGFRTRYEMRRDGKPEEEGVHIEGTFSHLDAFCGCGHRWRLRGVVHVDQLRGGKVEVPR